MKKLMYNQYQNVYQIEQSRFVIVDFLHNSIRVEESDMQPQYEYDQSCKLLSERIDRISDLKIVATLNIIIIFNLECNMNCIYCYESSMEKNHEQRGDPQEILTTIEKLLSRKDYQLIAVTFLGGEPILQSNFRDIEVIIEGVRKLEKPSSIGFISNGLDVHKYIDRVKNWKIDWMQITLDGMEKVHNYRRATKDLSRNGFLEIENGLKDLLSINVDVHLRINVDRYNVCHIGDLGRFIFEKGWDSKLQVYLYPVTLSANPNYVLVDTEYEIFLLLLNVLGQESQEIKDLFQLSFHGINYIQKILEKKMPLIRTRFCGVSNGQFVLHHGRIYSCWWALDEREFQIGTYGKDYCDIIEERECFFRDRCTTHIERCIHCKYKYICGGGCTFKEFKNHGTFTRGNCAEFDKMIGAYLNYVLR